MRLRCSQQSYKIRLIIARRIFQIQLCLRGIWAHLMRIRILGLTFLNPTRCHCQLTSYFQQICSTNRETACQINLNINISTLKEDNNQLITSPKTGMKELIPCHLWISKSNTRANHSALCNWRAQDITKLPPTDQTHPIAVLLLILLISSAGENTEQPSWFATFLTSTPSICFSSQLTVTSPITTTSSITHSTRTTDVDLATHSSTLSTPSTLLNSIFNTMVRDGTDLTARKCVV